MTTKISNPVAQRATDPRLTAPQGDDPRRDNRAMNDRAITESAMASDPELVARICDEFTNVALPSVPEGALPGFHTMWGSLSNTQDSIPFRLSIGYQLVKPEEVEGRWKMPPTLQTGDYVGMVGWKEMVLLKIPMQMYHALMQGLHHNAPLEQEQQIRSRLPKGQSVADHGERDGFEDLGRAPRRGIFN